MCAAWIVLRNKKKTSIYNQTIFDLNPSKGLEIMNCSNDVLKNVTHTTVKAGRTATSKIIRAPSSDFVSSSIPS